MSSVIGDAEPVKLLESHPVQISPMCTELDSPSSDILPSELATQTFVKQRPSQQPKIQDVLINTMSERSHISVEQPSRQQPAIQDVLKDWKYIWIIFGISLALFGNDIRAYGWLGVLQVEVCLLIMSTILGRLFFGLFHKIRQLREADTGNNDEAGEWLHFILSLCLVFIIYIFISVNAVLYRK